MKKSLFCLVVLLAASPLTAKESLPRLPKAGASKSAISYQKNYNALPTESEKKDIAYVVNTLGMASLIKIASETSKVEKAGKRIDNVHPLRFLECIFTDEQMKASMQAMRSRGWIWDKFSGGLKDALDTEYKKNNLAQFINDFSSRVGINLQLIYPSVTTQQWSSFIDILITVIPRNSDANRYRDV